MLFILPSISQGIAFDVLWASFDFKGDPLQFHKYSLRESRGNWRGFAESSKGNAIEGKLKGNRNETLLESKNEGNSCGIWQKLRRKLLFLAISFVNPRNPSYIDNTSPICFWYKQKFQYNENQRNQNPHANRNQTNPGQLVWWLCFFFYVSA